MVGTKSRRWKPIQLARGLGGEPFEAFFGKVFRSEGPRHTPVQMGLDHLELLQHSHFQSKRGDRPHTVDIVAYIYIYILFAF